MFRVVRILSILLAMFHLHASAAVVTVTKENYMQEVLESKLPVVLDAYAIWCGPCKTMAPIFSELSDEMAGKIKFAKFDVDQQKEMGKELSIRGMPTFLFFKNGEEVGRHTGMLDKKALSEKLRKALD
jgi:thioredoxin 1